MPGMTLQELCEQGQDWLMHMRYREAEGALCRAEAMAFAQKDWDTLGRLYLPLQECRRQRRQRCGEGTVRFDLLEDETHRREPEQILRDNPHGQLLVAGWGSIAPALQVRKLAEESALYVETFLAAVYPLAGGGRVVVIVPTENVALPSPEPRSIDALLTRLPAQSLVLGENELPVSVSRGTYDTFGRVMDLWEKLHAPFLAAADMQIDPLKKIAGYRRTIAVDYACELAHQKLSDVARKWAVERRKK